MNRRIVFLTLIGLVAAGLLLSACATEEVYGPRGDLGPKGPLGPQGQLGPQFFDGRTNAVANVAISLVAIGLGAGLGVLGSIAVIRARKPSGAVANSR